MTATAKELQGSFETYTSWFPFGDVPRDLGGLAVLAGSHKLGVLQPKVADGAGGPRARHRPNSYSENSKSEARTKPETFATTKEQNNVQGNEDV